MKKLFIIIGFIAAIAAVFFSVTPFYNLAIIPIAVAFISGLIIFFISKKEATKPKAIQYIFLLVIISLGITIYNGVYKTSEIGETEHLEQRAEEHLKDSKEILEDIDFDENL